MGKKSVLLLYTKEFADIIMSMTILWTKSIIVTAKRCKEDLVTVQLRFCFS